MDNFDKEEISFICHHRSKTFIEKSKLFKYVNYLGWSLLVSFILIIVPMILGICFNIDHKIIANITEVMLILFLIDMAINLIAYKYCSVLVHRKQKEYMKYYDEHKEFPVGEVKK